MSSSLYSRQAARNGLGRVGERVGERAGAVDVVQSALGVCRARLGQLSVHRCTRARSRLTSPIGARGQLGRNGSGRRGRDGGGRSGLGSGSGTVGDE